MKHNQQHGGAILSTVGAGRGFECFCGELACPLHGFSLKLCIQNIVLCEGLSY